LNRRSEELRQACRECKYEGNEEQFDKIIHQTNIDYEGVRKTTEISLPGVKVMAFEPEDINNLFEMLSDVMPNVTFPLNMAENQEKTYKCSFSLTSSMLKKMGPSREIYRDLVSGL